MPHATEAQANFNGGEWSPLAHGRYDLAKAKNAMALCQNFEPTVQGGLTRRPGTRVVNAVKDSSYAPRIRRFEFSTTQAYILEFGTGYIRFFCNEGALLNGGAPYEVATPYSITEVWQLGFTQTADTLYISHPGYMTRKLQRLGATNWTLSAISPLDGPYLPVNSSSTTFTPETTTPTQPPYGEPIPPTQPKSGETITITASSTTGINGGAGFRAQDVGRLVRVKATNVWLWGSISVVTDTTHVKVVLQNSGGTATETSMWRLGLWNAVDGYPSVVNFHGDRLMLGGSPSWPGRIDGSVVSDYENFAPSSSDGTVADNNAISFSLNSGTVNALRWMISDEWGLQCGTAGGEWVIAPSSSQAALTPTNVNTKQLGNYGSHTVEPVRVGKATLFVQRTKRKVRELYYQFTNNTFTSPDISAISEHLTTSGLKQMTVQLAPQQVVRMCRNDGKLVAMTYDRDQEVCGWHGHVVGGYSDAGHTISALVESLDTIPSSDGTRDQTWMVVNRYINGATVRTIEFMSKYWEDGDDLEHCCFLDGSAELTPVGRTISGLSWAKGETLGVLLDGAVHPDCVVDASGTITLQRTGTVAQVGFKYKSAVRTMRVEAGGAEGPAQGKLKRIKGVVIRFFQSIGLSLGSDTYGVSPVPIPWRNTYDPMDAAPPLFTGDKPASYDGSYTREGQVYFETDSPTPCNITLLVSQLDTQDNN